MTTPRLLRNTFLIAAAAIAALPDASAANIQKDNNQAALNVGTSFVGGSVPSGTDMIVFDSLYNNGASGTSINYGAALTISGFTFGAMSGTAGQTLTLGADSFQLNLGSSGIDASASTMNITLGGAAGHTINVTAPQTWTVNGGRTLRVGGATAIFATLTGSSDITLAQSGTGTAQFDLGMSGTGAGAFTGSWYIGANTLVRTVQNNAAALGTGRIYLNGGTVGTGIGAIQFGNWTWNNDIILQSGGGTIENTNQSGSGRTLTLNTHISGSGALTFNNAGGTTYTLSNVVTAGNSYSGGTTIGANAQVRLGNGGVLGSLGTGAIVNNSGSSIASSLNVARTGIFYLGNNISGTGRIDIGNGVASGLTYLTGTNTFSGASIIYGSAATYVSVGSLNTTNGNFGTSGISLLGGNLVYTGAGESITRGLTWGAVTTSGLYANGTGALSWTLSGVVGNNGNTTTARTVVLGGTNSASNTLGGYGLADMGTGVVSLNKTNVGTWVLNQLQTNTGATTISGGKLVLDFVNATAGVLKSGGALTFTSSGELSLLGKSATTSTQTLGTVSLTSGNAILSTSLNSATALSLNVGALSRSAGGVVQFIGNSGAALISTTQANSNGILGAWAVINTGTNQADYAVANGAGVNVSAYASYTGLTTIGNATATTNLSLAGGSTTTMAATTTGNVLKLTTATAATTLALGANAMTLNGLLVSNGATTGGAVTISGTGVLGAGATSEFILNNYSTSALTINAPLISTTATTGSLTKTGYGTVILTTATGNNAFTGAVTVNQGELQSYLVSPGTTTALAAGAYTPFGTGAITVNAGTTLRFKAGSTTNAYTYANAINLRDGTLISDDGVNTFSGAINSTGFSSIQTAWSGKTATFTASLAVRASLT